MGRGHNPEISPKERLKWLEKLEDGQGITSISEEARRDIRVVKRNIDLAKEERQTTRVRQDFLLGKLELHQQDLMGEVRRLKGAVSGFPPHHLVPDVPLEKKIHEALLEHINRLILKHLLESWEEYSVEFERELDSIREDLANQEKEAKAILPEEITTTDWRPTILEALERGSDLDGSPLIRLTHYKHPRVDGKFHPYWGPEKLTQDSLDDTSASLVIETHKELVEHSSKYLQSFDKWRGRLKELSEQIIDELDVFIIKRMVPGKCRYCPI